LSKKAFEHAAASSVHLIAQVKANQPALHHAITELCNTVEPLDSIKTTDKRRRSRDETRMVEVFAPGNSLADTEWDGHVSAVIRVNRDVLTRSAITGLWRSTSETALFVSGVVLPAAQCAKAIRDHWSIENRSHYPHLIHGCARPGTHYVYRTRVTTVHRWLAGPLFRPYL
jgi:hypothetical protein